MEQGTTKAVSPFPYATKTLIQHVLQVIFLPGRAVSNDKLFKVISSVIIIQQYHRLSFLQRI